MKEYKVKELMVPLSEYATVHEGVTLFEAILALEKAQEEFDHAKYRHRAILVLDKHGRVIGKVSHLDAIRALEPKPPESDELDELARFSFSPAFIMDLKKQRRLKSAPLKDLCLNAMTLKVEDVMQAPGQGEYIDQEASLVIAMHQLVMGDHLSLLVTRDKDIAGILRLTDVFAAVFHAMKEYETTLA
ncbi:MAG: CBS domain-containing protein [Desulfobacteraceae bacterium]|nr:MAG: CBS domain-containing protein [Desulfobacteraceae bacterium]